MYLPLLKKPLKRFMSIKLVLACLLGTFSVELMMFSESIYAKGEGAKSPSDTDSKYKSANVFKYQDEKLAREKAGTDGADGKQEKQSKMLQYVGLSDRKLNTLSDLDAYQNKGYRFKEEGVYLLKRGKRLSYLI